MFIKKVKLTLLIFSAITAFSSCKSKKVFNGTTSLDCTTFESEVAQKEQKKQSKYKLLLLKDGQRVFGKKTKRGKSSLFGKKVD
ncbi:hypothetical protein OA956_02350 [Bacteroidota bacterium]|nr:hypothetical protein [Bacteroidota bacterium]MDC3129715.1 hypothetical protein [Bacteroidota bacterium]MDC3153888.1 hypothetical protein [Bacteroidota bacterium]MDC3229881.1 hypothetical protein [Bacteroidota bacterium]